MDTGSSECKFNMLFQPGTTSHGGPFVRGKPYAFHVVQSPQDSNHGAKVCPFFFCHHPTLRLTRFLKGQALKRTLLYLPASATDTDLCQAEIWPAALSGPHEKLHIVASALEDVQRNVVRVDYPPVMVPLRTANDKAKQPKMRPVWPPIFFNYGRAEVSSPVSRCLRLPWTDQSHCRSL